MVVLSINIYSGSVLNAMPITYVFDYSNNAINFIRNNAFNICKIVHNSYSSIRKTSLLIYIYETVDEYRYCDWNFEIDINNVREFKRFIGISREDFDLEIKRVNRNDIINDLIN